MQKKVVADSIPNIELFYPPVHSNGTISLARQIRHDFKTHFFVITHGSEAFKWPKNEFMHAFSAALQDLCLACDDNKSGWVENFKAKLENLCNMCTDEFTEGLLKGVPDSHHKKIINTIKTARLFYKSFLDRDELCATNLAETINYGSFLIELRGRFSTWIEYTLTGDETITVIAKEGLLFRAFLNLLSNAATSIIDRRSYLQDAQKETFRGKILVELEKDRDTVKIRIHDNGKGMSSRQVQAFNNRTRFSTKAGSHAEGLAITRSAIEEHGGTLSIIRNQVTHGLTWEVVLPLKPTR